MISSGRLCQASQSAPMAPAAWSSSGRWWSIVNLESLHLPGNATHGFMDFVLMMGVAGEGQKADYVDTYDLFHTRPPSPGTPAEARGEPVPAEHLLLHRRPRS